MKVRQSIWLRHDLLNRLSNSLTSIASGIKHCFGEVRSFEAFKQLHLGLISEVKRKTLPAIATVAGLDNAQSLHHFLTESPWKVSAFRQQRLRQILQTVGEREIVLIIDDTGDRKKGQHTDVRQTAVHWQLRQD